jgi:hypothetical protein
VVDHVHYAPSPGGELLRYRHHRRVLRPIQAFRGQVGEGAATDRAAGTVFSAPVLPALWILRGFQIPLVAAFALSLFAW